MIPRDPTEIEAIAAEYVLGTLEGQREEVRRILEHGADPGSDDADIDAGIRLQRAVSWWERHLSGLTKAVPVVPPPPELWMAIERRVAEAPSAEIVPFTAKKAAARRPALRESLALWRSVAGAAIAACLALVVWSRMTATIPVSAIALLTPTGGATPAMGSFLLEREGSRLRLTSLDAAPTPADRDLELWSLGGGVPAPLGIVRPAAYLAPAPFALSGVPAPDTPLAISLEPAGGSATGKPTGPVLYIGKLTAVTRS